MTSFRMSTSPIFPQSSNLFNSNNKSKSTPFPHPRHNLRFSKRAEDNPTFYWEQFYRRHQDKFFKDRHYLAKDWGQYFSVSTERNDSVKQKVVLEVGCGAGNTLFPLLDAFPDAYIHACDFSSRAISLIKENEAFRSVRVNAFVCDVTLDDLRKEISPASVDVVTLEKLEDKNQMISKNFYVRGDGTLAFYFSEESLSKLFSDFGFRTLDVSIYSKQIVNLSRKVVMGCRWIRGEFCRADYCFP